MSEDTVSQSVPPPAIKVFERAVDGVRVLHFPDDSGRTAAALIFGVGARDETLPTLGTLHALEHAVMTEVRRTPIDINGSVDVSTTQFTAEGSTAHVGSFLTGVCRGLADPPIGRLAHEARVLEAEKGSNSGGTSPAAVARYGFRGLGVIDGPGPGPDSVRGDAVRAAAARWFIATNTLLVVEGAWPEDLRLPLPDGAPAEHAYVPIRHVSRPSAIVVDAPVCELNLVMPSEPATLTRLAVTVLVDRLTELLRHDLGLAYTIDIETIPIQDAYDITVATDPTPGRVRDCVRAMVEATRTLMADGPTDIEAEAARASVRESLQGRDAHIGAVVDAAIDELLGSQAKPIDPSSIAGYDKDQITEHLRRIAADLIYVVGSAVEPDLPSLGLDMIEPEPTTTDPLPTGEIFRPPLMALAMSKDARASRVVLTSAGLAHAHDGRLQQVTWSEVVGVLREDGDIVVFGQEGQAIPVGPTLYRKGQRLIDAISAHIPAHLIYNAPPTLDEGDVTTDRSAR